MTTQTTEAVQAAASVDETFWDIILADPELAAAQFAPLAEPEGPPRRRLPPADRPGSGGPQRAHRSAPIAGRGIRGGGRGVPAVAAGTVRGPPTSPLARDGGRDDA
ncbi:hypothetical protein [Streptacidiphilus rugosus]|uniref:hypothetical protein n=1 Tax=Streptacidiphilus rugosus TaxID=405783 RepID=UPI00055E88EA|nr:hypothetical protein [Streptacidiphilus rugosus]